MKVYLREINTHDDWLFDCRQALVYKNIPFEYFKDVTTIPISKDNLVIGYVEDCIYYFNKLNVKIPAPLNIPQELNLFEYTQRQIYTQTYSDFLLDNKLPVFVKPATQLKLFNGGVITSNFLKPFILPEAKPDTLLLVSDVIDIVSEYRCFIYKNQLVGMKNYIGDFTKFTDIDTISCMILDYKSSPIAYTIDVGILSNGRTVLIECNDFWSTANYNFDYEIYLSMLRDRWFEIIKT